MDPPFDENGSQQTQGSWSGWPISSFTRIMGFSLLTSVFSNMYVFDSVKLFVLGSVIEMGRRLCQWLIERFRFQYSVTAQFDEGDPSYEWIVLFLTQENVWCRSRDFRVGAKNSKRKWGIKTGPEGKGNADYVPTYEKPQLFRWKGYWVEIKRGKGTQSIPHHGGNQAATIYVSIYTLNMEVLSDLVEEARLRYIEVSRPNVTVYIADMPTYGPGFVWSNVKHKARRPLTSIILLDGVIESLVKDAQEFIDSEAWYVNAGIPHRRGYLLYGPPGTGKTSTIYALAGELGLEIYSLSLSSGFVDDSFLQKAASSMPKNSILLIEDIDCAFPSRDDADDEEPALNTGYPGVVGPSFGRSGRKSAVTLSGLLNVIDGVGSEEGKLFFATTNYVDRLDSALLRPGRIDRKVQYKLATKEQAAALFTRFYAEMYQVAKKDSSTAEKDITPLSTLADKFAEGVPEYEFSTAELQGFLLSCKTSPEEAVAGIFSWTEQELMERQQKETREAKRKDALREKREKSEARKLEGTIARLGGMGLSMHPSTTTGNMIVGGPLTPSSPSPAYEDPPRKSPSVTSSESTTSLVMDTPVPDENVTNPTSTIPPNL